MYFIQTQDGNSEDMNNFPILKISDDKLIFRLEGRSVPEDARIIYEQIVEELDKYTLAKEDLLFTFKLDYFNTAFARKIADILKYLENTVNTRTVNIQWYHFEDDEDMEEAGKVFKELTALPFILKSMSL